MPKNLVFIFVNIVFVVYDVSSQVTDSSQTISRLSMSVDEVKSIQYLEDLMYDIPKDAVIDDCRISFSGKGFMKREQRIISHPKDFERVAGGNMYFSEVKPGMIITIDRIHLKTKLNAGDRTEALPVEITVTK